MYTCHGQYIHGWDHLSSLTILSNVITSHYIIGNVINVIFNSHYTHTYDFVRAVGGPLAVIQVLYIGSQFISQLSGLSSQ